MPGTHLWQGQKPRHNGGGDPGPRRVRSRSGGHCRAMPTIRQRATWKRPSAAFLDRVPLRAQRATRNLARNSITSSRGSTGSSRMRPDCGTPARRSVLAGDFNVVPTPMADIYSDAVIRRRRAGAAAKPRGVPAPVDAGWTDAIRAAPSARNDLHVLGLHAQAVGAQCRSCASTICCSNALRCKAGSSTPMSTSTCADGRARAITHRRGSRSDDPSVQCRCR